MKKRILSVQDLKIAFPYDGKLVTVVDSVSFEVYQGETLGLVGESGSGKSVTSKAILRLIEEPPGKICGGQVVFDGKDLLQLSNKEMRQVRGGKISMIFQEPMTSLNPIYTCGNQIMESILLHRNVDKAAAKKLAIDMLRLVGVQSPETRINAYPFELSGGMRQRVMIAMALSSQPDILIADEPTTALDPTIQAQILRLIRDIQAKMGLSVLFITHDLGVVAEMCDRVAVMYAGKIVEIAPVVEIFHSPAHPYTQGLIDAVPRLDKKQDMLYSIKGAVPSFAALPKGCAFGPRCPYYSAQCETPPPCVQLKPDWTVRCWRAAVEKEQ